MYENDSILKNNSTCKNKINDSLLFFAVTHVFSNSWVNSIFLQHFQYQSTFKMHLIQTISPETSSKWTSMKIFWALLPNSVTQVSY